MQLRETVDVNAGRRLASIRALNDTLEDWNLARDIEMAAHAISTSSSMYADKMHQVISNLHFNPSLKEQGVDIVLMDDREMAKGTIIEDIENESLQKQQRFEHILQEKYECVNRESTRATLRCGRCGSADVQVEQKQTRGADEAMTVFCTCQKCRKRWTMR